MIKLSRGALVNLALYAPIAAAILVAAVAGLTGAYVPGIVVSVAGFVWGALVTALMWLFEPALIAWLNPE